MSHWVTLIFIALFRAFLPRKSQTDSAGPPVDRSGLGLSVSVSGSLVSPAHQFPGECGKTYGRKTGRDLFNLRLLKVSQDCVSGVEILSVTGTRAVQESIHLRAPSHLCVASRGFVASLVPQLLFLYSPSLPPIAVGVRILLSALC